MLYLLEELLPYTTHLNLELISWAASVSNFTTKYTEVRLFFVSLLSLHLTVISLLNIPSLWRLYNAVSNSNFTTKYTLFRVTICISVY